MNYFGYDQNLYNIYIYTMNKHWVIINPRIHTPVKSYPEQVSGFGSNMVLLFFLAQDPNVILKNPKKTLNLNFG